MRRVRITTDDVEEAAKVIVQFLEEPACIVGPSASGKSVLAKSLARLTGGTVISTDDFYIADAWKWAQTLSTFDHPRLLDWRLLKETLEELSKGAEEVEVPVYDMSVSTRAGYRKVKVSRPIIVEGIFAYYGPLRSFCKTVIAVESPPHLLLARRALRDVKRAMEAPSRTFDRVIRTVFPMAKLFVEPQTREASITVVNVWKPPLPYELEGCSEGGEGEGLEGERRVIKLSYGGDAVYIIENFVDEVVEHYLLVSWEGKYVGARVHPETAYASISTLAAHGYALKAYYQAGRWEGDAIVGELREEVSWRSLGNKRCCKLCAP